MFVQATTGGQGMPPYFMCFAWLSLEQNCQLLTLAFVKKHFSEELMETVLKAKIE
jgi:hypothetical protein